jgi:ectoine hydroxylase-related dioxygenase (phytanoyl-CoA dioxygenase family)
MSCIEALEDAAPLLHDTVALRERAHRCGYVFFRQLLDRALVMDLRQSILEACARRAWLDPDAPIASARPAAGMRLGAYDAPWLDLQYELYSLAGFAQLERHPSLLAVAEQILGKPMVSGTTVACRLMSPHAAELTTPPHQDRFYFPNAEDQWTAWIPLGDTPPRCGGLAVLEGSHGLGLQPHAHRGEGVYGAEIRAQRPWLTASYSAGDVLLFHSLTVHRALDNVSESLRISVDLRFVPASDGAPGSGAEAARASAGRS